MFLTVFSLAYVFLCALIGFIILMIYIFDKDSRFKYVIEIDTSVVIGVALFIASMAHLLSM